METLDCFRFLGAGVLLARDDAGVPDLRLDAGVPSTLSVSSALSLRFFIAGLRAVPFFSTFFPADEGAALFLVVADAGMGTGVIRIGEERSADEARDAESSRFREVIFLGVGRSSAAVGVVAMVRGFSARDRVGSSDMAGGTFSRLGAEGSFLISGCEAPAGGSRGVGAGCVSVGG